MLISVAHTHRDKIDVADLEINIKEYPTYEADTHTQLTVLAQNSDCWKVSTGLKSVNRSSLNFNMRANLEGRCCLAIEGFFRGIWGFVYLSAKNYAVPILCH